jgi:hypothetical protein
MSVKTTYKTFAVYMKRGDTTLCQGRLQLKEQGLKLCCHVMQFSGTCQAGIKKVKMIIRHHIICDSIKFSLYYRLNLSILDQSVPAMRLLASIQLTLVVLLSLMEYTTNTARRYNNNELSCCCWLLLLLLKVMKANSIIKCNAACYQKLALLV